jgi:hypothetical protein
MVLPLQRNRNAFLYFILCCLFWFIIDFGTAGGFKLSYFEKYGFTLAIFYLGYPIIFTFLIFKRHYSNVKIFIATLVAIFIIEVIFTTNPLVMQFPVMLLGIPLAIAIYTPLTFFPLWIIRKEMKSHIRIVISLIVVEAIIILLTTFGNGK